METSHHSDQLVNLPQFDVTRCSLQEQNEKTGVQEVLYASRKCFVQIPLVSAMVLQRFSSTSTGSQQCIRLQLNRHQHREVLAVLGALDDWMRTQFPTTVSFLQQTSADLFVLQASLLDQSCMYKLMLQDDQVSTVVQSSKHLTNVEGLASCVVSFQIVREVTPRVDAVVYECDYLTLEELEVYTQPSMYNKSKSRKRLRS